MTACPTVSVVMAAYKGADLITETLDSLQQQTFGDFELVVVDDCSPDETAAVIRAYGDPRIRLIRAERNAGCVHARNRAFAEARGRYIVGLDHDDICLPERFAKQVAFLDSNPEVVLVGTATKLLENGTIRPHPRPTGLTPDLIDWLMLTRNPLVWSSVMFRADAARRLEIFERPDLLYAEDFDLYHRLRPFGKIAELDAVLTLYRNHPGGLSKLHENKMLAQAAVVLEQVHADLLGESDPQMTERIVRHVMARQPVPDAATLSALFLSIDTLHRAFADRYQPGEAAREAVRQDIARIWHQLCRAAIRSGAVPMHQARSAAPTDAATGHGQVDLLVSRMVGQVRAMRRDRFRA
ncbi:hypothetical protein GCM10023219_00780 [Stakelama sediminis]|uniref:Glycosyltransferase 2-like domain-containing protein n=1 Tax=Stakelama sediminis TaxID=463200 RepID=A0A840Z192_9SPHN|nr:glycosyltransferase family A protein [Stakelama sediminis]MBB5719486.1 hypothetical protein [Stakelama sediminis]